MLRSHYNLDKKILQTTVTFFFFYRRCIFPACRGRQRSRHLYLSENDGFAVWPLASSENLAVISFSFTTSLSRRSRSCGSVSSPLEVQSSIMSRYYAHYRSPVDRSFYFNSWNCELRDAFMQGHARHRSLHKSIKSAKEREHTHAEGNFNVPFAWRLRLQSKSNLRPCSFFRWCWNNKSEIERVANVRTVCEARQFF